MMDIMTLIASITTMVLMITVIVEVKALQDDVRMDRIRPPTTDHSYLQKARQGPVQVEDVLEGRVMAKASSAGKDDTFDEPDWDAARKRMAKSLYDDARREGRGITMNEADALATDILGGFLGG